MTARNTCLRGTAMLVLLASLTACTVAKQPAIELDPALLSASEAGGNQTALTPDAWMSAAKCGPDIEDAYGGGWDPEATARSNVVRFADDRESTVLVMALIEMPQSCSSEFLRSRGQVSAGSCRS